MPKFSPIPLSQDVPNPAGLMSEEYDEGLPLYVVHPDVVSLPESGKITFYFRRGPVTIKEGREDEGASASVDLTLTEICAVEECEVEEKSEPKMAEHALDSLFEQLRGGKKESGEEED